MSSHNWKKNVYAVAVAEFLVIVGFNSVMPFLPLLMKEIGGVDNAGAALWAGVATGGAGLAMFVSSPLWGIAADRWGRKPMMLRAQFGGALIVLLMAFAPNIGSLVALRIVQGMLTGTIAAASALVSSQSPPDRLTFSMGILMGAIFSGSTIGPFLGGLLADSLGYRTTFIIMSGIVLISALIILFTVSEKFERASGQRIASPSGLWQLAVSREMFPLLIIVFAIFTGPSMITLIIPLSISEISPYTAAATYSGIALGLKGLLSVVASVSISRFGQRLTLKRTMLTAAFLAGIAYSLPMFVTEITVFVILIGMTGLFVGALQTTSNTLIGLSVPHERQGTAYGLASSATSLGFGGGGFAGGSLAAIIGFRPIFGITGMLFIVIGFLVLKLIKR